MGQPRLVLDVSQTGTDEEKLMLLAVGLQVCQQTRLEVQVPQVPETAGMGPEPNTWVTVCHMPCWSLLLRAQRSNTPGTLLQPSAPADKTSPES